jgi:prevent-host-death family protein
MAAQHTIHEAKTHLSKLVARVEAGEEIVIARGKTPVARLVPIAPEPKKTRQLGWLKGQVALDDSFFEPMSDDELREWGVID